MPRRQRQRPSPEAAVAASPLFDLPLEIRWMIYKLLLIQDNGLAIAEDVFKRRSRRDSNRPCNCSWCGRFFTNHLNLTLHARSSPHHFIRSVEHRDDPKLPDLPNLNPSILHTCRLVHDEAMPILYKLNAFYFSDLNTVDAFRWGIGTKYAYSIQEIRFSCAIAYQKSHLWRQLSENLPQLKRMSLRLSTPLDFHRPIEIDRQLGELARNFRRLDWVHLQGPSAGKFLEILTPAIERDSEVGVMRVQKHVAAPSPNSMSFHNFLTQGSATIWWGRDGEQAPEGTRRMR